jgi:hypothetical protein
MISISYIIEFQGWKRCYWIAAIYINVGRSFGIRLC